MAIYSYIEDGKEFWKVYVNLRSKINTKRRIQKYSYRLASEAAALKEEKKLIQLASRELQKIDGSGLDWEDILRIWEVEVKAGHMGNLSERSMMDYLSTVHKWTKHWNGRLASSLNRADGRDVLIMLNKANLSQAYKKKAKHIISKIYEWGVEYGYIVGGDSNPMKGLVLEKGEEKVPDILSMEEIKRFLTAAKAVAHRWYPVWSMAVLTGMRSGELHALTWDQIDFEKKQIIVDRSYDPNTGKVGSTKARYWRAVPINKNLHSLLIEQKSNPEIFNSGYVLPRMKDWDNGDQVVPLKNFLRSIKMRPIKFHALRACFATQMLASGVPAPIVMKIGGWKKTSTMDIYLRLAGVDVGGATECLQFIPDQLDFSDNVVNLFGQRENS